MSKVFEADDIVGKMNVNELEATPRKPDVRLIINNPGDEVKFMNPGQHSDTKEVIPSGKAVMAMVQGETLAEQVKNAKLLSAKYNLKNGFNPKCLEDPKLKEAYGPADFEPQAGKLKPLSWENQDGSKDEIDSTTNGNVAYGARPPAKENVFIFRTPVKDGEKPSLKGTNTNAENLTVKDGFASIAVAIDPVLDSNWQPTGEFTTKPIDMEVAKEFYGKNFNKIPVYNQDGQCLSNRSNQRNNDTITR